MSLGFFNIRLITTVPHETSDVTSEFLQQQQNHSKTANGNSSPNELSVQLRNVLQGNNKVWKDSILLKPFIEHTEITMSSGNSVQQYNNDKTQQRSVQHILFGDTIERASSRSRLSEFVAYPAVQHKLRVYINNPDAIDQLDNADKLVEFEADDEKRLREIYKKDFTVLVKRYGKLIYNALKVYAKKMNEESKDDNDDDNDEREEIKSDTPKDNMMAGNITMSFNIADVTKSNNTTFIAEDDESIREAKNSLNGDVQETTKLQTSIKSNNIDDKDNSITESQNQLNNEHIDDPESNKEKEDIAVDRPANTAAEESKVGEIGETNREVQFVRRREPLHDRNPRLRDTDFVRLPLAGNVTKDTRIFYFLHIHKSAGTSFCEAAQMNKMTVNKRKNCNVQLDQRCCGYSDTMAAQQEFAATTHYNFVANEQHMYSSMDIEHYRYIVILRNSYSRYKSHYKHTAKRAGGRFARRKPFYNDTFLKWWQGQPDNWNLRKICGTACEDVPKYALSHYHFLYTLSRLLLFDDIIFVEKYDQSYQVFAKKVGWQYQRIHQKDGGDPYSRMRRYRPRDFAPVYPRRLGRRVSRRLQEVYPRTNNDDDDNDYSEKPIRSSNGTRNVIISMKMRKSNPVLDTDAKFQNRTLNNITSAVSYNGNFIADEQSSQKREYTNRHRRLVHRRYPSLDRDDMMRHHLPPHLLLEEAQEVVESPEKIAKDKEEWDFMMSALDDALYEYAMAKYDNKNMETYQLSNQLHEQISQYFQDGPARNCTHPCCTPECTMY